MPYKDKEKQKAAQAAHYQANKSAYLERSKETVRRNRLKLRELKDKPCVDCGEKYPFYVMQFDHMGTDKVANVSKIVHHNSWQAVVDEIAKCELVCANCHAERSWQRATNNASV